MKKIVFTGDIIQTVETNYIKPRGGARKKNTSSSESKRTKSRTDNYYTLVKSLQQGRDIINTNVTVDNHDKVTWLTLTYKDNMTDTKKLYNDWNNFFNRYIRKKGKAEYIIACEPQARGSWHIHSLIIWENMPLLPHKEVLKAWGKGSVFLKKLSVSDPKTGKKTEISNVGVYLSEYLTSTDSKKKERLKFYPAKFRPFRWSRGVKLPLVKYLDDCKSCAEFDCLCEAWERIKKEYALARTYSTTKVYDNIRLKDKPLIINYEYYNLNLLNSQ